MTVHFSTRRMTADRSANIEGDGHCSSRRVRKNISEESGKGAMQGRQTVRRFASIGIVALAIGAQEQAAEAQSLVTRVHDIATGLAACWHPPHDDDQVTVRISFTREGAVIGEPTIVFVRSSGGRANDAVLADSMMAAIHDCTPLHFSARARRGDRGAGSGDSLHRSQPGNHRRPALMNSRPLLICRY